MSLDEINWKWEDFIDYLELFAYPGEIPKLVELARRFLDASVAKDDGTALGDGVLALADALQEAGYEEGPDDPEAWGVYDFALVAIVETDWIVLTWRTLSQLPYAEVERLVRMVKKEAP